MKQLFTAEFWDYAGERAVKTAAQTLIAAVGSTALFTDVGWETVGGVVLLAAILSLATSLAGDWETGAAVKKAEKEVKQAAARSVTTVSNAHNTHVRRDTKGTE